MGLDTDALASAIVRHMAPAPRMPLSDTAKEIAARGLAKTTASKYARMAEGFVTWCAEQHIDPRARDPHAVANFVAELAEARNWKAQTVQAYVSGINHWLALETDQKLPQCRALTLLARGVAKGNPAEPKYTSIWDLTRVTHLFLEKWGENADLTERQLLGKLLVLLEASGLRLCDQIGIRMKTSKFRGPDHSMNLLTTTKESQSLKLVSCPIIGDSQHPRICAHCVTAEMFRRRHPVHSLECFYVFLRGTENIGHVGEAISEDSLRKCIHAVLAAAGVPAEFTAHSCRHASSSKAVELGVSQPALHAQFRWAPNSKVPIRHYIRISRKRVVQTITTGLFNSFVLDVASLEFNEEGHLILEEEEEVDEDEDE